MSQVRRGHCFPANPHERCVKHMSTLVVFLTNDLLGREIVEEKLPGSGADYTVEELCTYHEIPEDAVVLRSRLCGDWGANVPTNRQVYVNEELYGHERSKEIALNYLLANHLRPKRYSEIPNMAAMGVRSWRDPYSLVKLES